MKKEEHTEIMNRALQLAHNGVHDHDGGPFGAVIVKNGKVIGEGFNTVTSARDPTAHAEINAIRNACEKINSFQLSGCDIYCTSEPCPMCLGAIYWARIDRIYYSTNRQDAAKAGFDDSFLYEQFNLAPANRNIKMHQLSHTDGMEIFKGWAAKKDKILY